MFAEVRFWLGVCVYVCSKDVNLDWPWIGQLDWFHWTKQKAVQKGAIQKSDLIGCACAGKACPCPTAAKLYGFYGNNPTTFSWSNGSDPFIGFADKQGADLTGLKLPAGTIENLVTIPADAADDVIVQLFTGTCGSTGALNVTLLSATGAVRAPTHTLCSRLL